MAPEPAPVTSTLSPPGGPDPHVLANRAGLEPTSPRSCPGRGAVLGREGQITRAGLSSPSSEPAVSSTSISPTLLGDHSQVPPESVVDLIDALLSDVVFLSDEQTQSRLWPEGAGATPRACGPRTQRPRGTRSVGLSPGHRPPACRSQPWLCGLVWFCHLQNGANCG